MYNEGNFQNDDLRHALIIAGIKEVEAHGLADFSLRRVASECGVSCAAPYRHFKSKSDLILAIIEYINEQWSLLERQIFEVFASDTRKKLIELCIANIRFWIANPNFRSIMMMDDRGLDTLQLRERSRISDETKSLISEYCQSLALSKEKTESVSFSVRSILYGATQMLGSGELRNTPENIEMIRGCLDDALTL